MFQPYSDDVWRWRWRRRGVGGGGGQVVGPDQRRPTPPGKQRVIRPSSSHPSRRDIPLSVMGSNGTHDSPLAEGGGGEDSVRRVRERLVRQNAASRFSCHILHQFFRDRTPPPTPGGVGWHGWRNATNAGADRKTMPSFFRPGTASHFFSPFYACRQPPLTSHFAFLPVFLPITTNISRSWICGRRCPPICLPLAYWTCPSAWNYGAFLSVSILVPFLCFVWIVA